MNKIPRVLNFTLPPGQSAFLWGPRKTGKTTFLKERFPHSLIYDFLDTDLFLAFSKRPALLRELLLAKDAHLLESPIILDEVQKVPMVLDEVHRLIENDGLRFILCGSSARKLKRGQANLLGGRAWRYELFPLVSSELGRFDLLKALDHGLLPAHFLTADHKKTLRAYVQDYLKEEVFAEGLTRNIPAFSRFFDAMGFTHGELVNYSNIARECAVDSKTVREYFQILVDTLLGTMVEPFRKRQERQVIGKAPRFYLFDVGVAGAVVKRSLPLEKGEAFGRAFEHLIFMELSAHRSYSELHYDINFWRTKSGLEVDFILAGGEVAVEVKAKSSLDGRDFRAMRAFVEDYAPSKAIIVSLEREERMADSIHIMPWRKFLSALWAGEIIS